MDMTEPVSVLPPIYAETPVTPEMVEQKAEEAGAKAEAEAEDSSGEGGAFNPLTGEINWNCPCL